MGARRLFLPPGLLLPAPLLEPPPQFVGGSRPGDPADASSSILLSISPTLRPTAGAATPAAVEVALERRRRLRSFRASTALLLASSAPSGAGACASTWPLAGGTFAPLGSICSVVPAEHVGSATEALAVCSCCIEPSAFCAGVESRARLAWSDESAAT